MRYWDWVARLNEAVSAASKRPFDYGSENCGLFAAQCIDAICEDSHRAEELRTHLGSVEAAARFLNDEGGIEAAVTARLGTPLTWPNARRGDVCLMPTQDGPGLGVCVGDTVAMMSPSGVSHLRIDKALRVWRVD
jgi:hypothetical protein